MAHFELIDAFREPTCEVCGNTFKEVVPPESGICDDCHKAYGMERGRRARTRAENLRTKYNMSYQDYAVMYSEQNGQCWICGEPIALVKNDKGIKTASVDHDHGTGEVRGLLCNSCNSGIGFLKEDIKVLEKAAEYLKK